MMKIQGMNLKFTRRYGWDSEALSETRARHSLMVEGAKRKYPILAENARVLFTMQISYVASESFLAQVVWTV